MKKPVFQRGVINIVTGGNETGQALVEHPLVRMISLTGSTNTGKRVMETAAKTLKRVHLELGGKAPVIVFDDADPEEVAPKPAWLRPLTQGRTAQPRPASTFNRTGQKT